MDCYRGILCGCWLLAALGCAGPGIHAGECGTTTIRGFAENDRRKVETLVYKEVGDLDLRLLVCKPDKWEKGQRRPAMVWIHGGGWVAGAPEGFIPHMKYSAARGAVGVAIQYRLVKGRNYRNDRKKSDEENRLAREAKAKAFVEGPSIRDCIDDSEDAIRYIRRNADALGVDPRKICVIGDSAGGHLAACLGTLADADARADAVIDCNGIVDMTSGNWFGYIKPGADREARARAASPLFNIPADAPPFLILHGKRDGTVKQAMAEAFVEALDAKCVNRTYALYETAQHAFIVYGYSATLEETTRAILDLDEFLVEFGLLEGPTSIKMPEYEATKEAVVTIPGPFTGKQVAKREGDFPGFLTISLKIKPAKRFKGTLFRMPGSYGCYYRISNRDHDFGGRRMRLRGKQNLFNPEVWQDVTISLGRDKVVITVDAQVVEISNGFQHAFISDELVFAEGLDAEIRDVEVLGYATK
jgi:acetyl esterase/lipase